jgi:hypothetical protein
MLESVDIYILGRIMYPLYEQYWMAVLTNPSMRDLNRNLKAVVP